MKKIIFLFVAITQMGFAQVNITKTIKSGGVTREYNIYVPDIYNAANAVPLVINMHGYGSNMGQQSLYGNFKNLADVDNFIIIHPNGTLDNTNTRYWNAFGASGGIDDVAFISNLIDTISADYNIDSSMVFSTGMSNGGFMSYKLACELNDKIAKIASVTGTMTTPLEMSCSPLNAIPVMQIHGTADPTVPYNGGGAFTPIEDVIDFWVAFNNCDTTPSISVLPDINTSDSSTVELFNYTNGDDDSEVIFYKITNGGHTWPSAIVDIPSGNTNKDFNASEVIWEFFKGEEFVTNIKNSLEENTLNLFVGQNEIKLADEKGIEHISIVNALGQVFINTKVTTINTSNLNKGIYFVVVKTNKGTFSKSFIK